MISWKQELHWVQGGSLEGGHEPPDQPNSQACGEWCHMLYFINAIACHMGQYVLHLSKTVVVQMAEPYLGATLFDVPISHVIKMHSQWAHLGYLVTPTYVPWVFHFGCMTKILVTKILHCKDCGNNLTVNYLNVGKRFITNHSSSTYKNEEENQEVQNC